MHAEGAASTEELEKGESLAPLASVVGLAFAVMYAWTCVQWAQQHNFILFGGAVTVAVAVLIALGFILGISYERRSKQPQPQKNEGS